MQGIMSLAGCDNTDQHLGKFMFTNNVGKTDFDDVPLDQFGNPIGNEYDLAKDGAFKGFSIAVLHLYTGEGFDFSKPEAALKEKGFDIIRWTDGAPPFKEFQEKLWTCCQLWIISNKMMLLRQDFIVEIKRYFDAGYGVYIWGDNDPYYVDANNVGTFLLGASMAGNVQGDQNVYPQKADGEPGFMKHLITTGLNVLYEGITIATIQQCPGMTPLVFGSAKNLVTALFDKNGKRALFDGGFTRLFLKWDTAGTGRYVKNAAAWLANYEQWGRHEHVAAERHDARQLEMNVQSPPLFYHAHTSGKLTVGGYWETDADGTITVIDPDGQVVKEEAFSGSEHYFDVDDTKAGNWSACIKFTGGDKKKYTYVLNFRRPLAAKKSKAK
jgi:hypothetical protein